MANTGPESAPRGSGIVPKPSYGSYLELVAEAKAELKTAKDLKAEHAVQCQETGACQRCISLNYSCESKIGDLKVLVRKFSAHYPQGR